MTYTTTAAQARETAARIVANARLAGTPTAWNRAQFAAQEAVRRTRRGTDAHRQALRLFNEAHAWATIAGGVADAETMRAARLVLDAIVGPSRPAAVTLTEGTDGRWSWSVKVSVEDFTLASSDTREQAVEDIAAALRSHNAHDAG